jgi:hypothetical protein
MRSRSALVPALAAAVLAGGIGALVATSAAPAATSTATKFKNLPVKTQVLIADRHAITAISRANAVRSRFREVVTYDVAGVDLVSRGSTQCDTRPGCSPLEGREINGLLGGARGSLFAPLPLPDGSTITGLKLRFRDNDGAVDANARIMRRSSGGAYAPTSGLSVVRQVTTSGASNDLRTVSATVTSGGKVNPASSSLYVEVFVPPTSEIQIASVQVTYRPKPLSFPKVKLP